jgi:DNA polymerase III subunit gamma/tau
VTASLALARKYRPRNFTDFFMGQEHVVKALSHALETGRLHQAYLLTGTRGIGKTTIARILAKTLNCETGVTPSPCGVCQSCVDIDAGRFPDLIELDAASNTGVDNMREIIDNARYAPTSGRYKVYLIDEVHMLSKSAFNSMLKTLEEPPEHVKFVLATTDPQKIPVTVLSRCLQFNLKAFPPERVAEQLHKVLTAENVPFDAKALRLIGEAANGSMRDALSITDQAIAFGHGKVDETQVRQMLGNVDRDFVWRVLDAVVAKDAQALDQECDRCFENALSADDALSQLARALHRVALFQAVAASVDSEDPDHPHIERIASQIDAETTQLYYQIALHGRDDLRLAPDEQTALMMTFLRLLAFSPNAGSVPTSAGREPARETVPQTTQNAFQARASVQASARAAERAGASRNAQPSAGDDSSLVTRPRIESGAGYSSSNGQSPNQIQDTTLSVNAPLNRAFDGDWHKLVLGLPLAAMAKELARHAVLLSHENHVFKLAVPQDKRPLATTQKERLQNTLSEYFGRPVKLDIELTDLSGAVSAGGAGESIATKEVKAKDEKQAAAEAAFLADPAVQVLLKEGNGRIPAGSITAG